jgi:CDP-glucose 4,6-dehydratase
MLQQFYTGKQVFVTGHTGFKGAWLSLWLKKLGAKVGGFANEVPTNPNLYSLIQKHAFEREFTADVRDYGQIQEALRAFQPEIIFHLAAQSLVRRSYEQPIETFLTNTVGTLNLLEAVRQEKLAATIVLVTTDKCYENKEWNFAYRENDSLGGLDPYSASKAAAEIVIHSCRESFFKTSARLGPVASARAGNVIGGGDYAQDRIVPDAIRALLAGKELEVRNPAAIRPWQHVLDCLHGYLVLGKTLTELGPKSEIASAFNFGPGPEASFPVRKVVEEIFRVIPGKWHSPPQVGQRHEAGKLNLAIDKAAALLGWAPTWSFREAIEKTVRWYDERHFKKNPDMLGFSLSQVEEFEAAAKQAKGDF